MAERGLLIGEKLRTLRNERAWTQQDLAHKSGVHAVTISELEGNKRRAAAQTMRKLARGLQVDVRELTMDDSRNPSGEQRVGADRYMDIKYKQHSEERVEGEPGD